MPTFDSIHDIIDYAIRQETQAFTFYRDLAQCVQRDSLRAVLEGFAADELAHRMRLEGLKQGTFSFDTDDDIGSLNLAETVPDVQPQASMSYRDLLCMAMRKELHAYRTYTLLALHTQDPKLQRVFQQLARVEAEHKLRIEIEYDLLTF
jgi:rubrerythrin